MRLAGHHGLKGCQRNGTVVATDSATTTAGAVGTEGVATTDVDRDVELGHVHGRALHLRPIRAGHLHLGRGRRTVRRWRFGQLPLLLLQGLLGLDANEIGHGDIILLHQLPVIRCDQLVHSQKQKEHHHTGDR